MFSAGFTGFPCPPTFVRRTEHETPFLWANEMTKSEHKQRAMDLAYQIKRCYSKPAKKAMVSECLRTLIKSLRVPE